MSGLTVPELMATAKAHLGLPVGTPDNLVPKFYIDNLRYHLMMCPNEDKFRVTLQPNIGFGSVFCVKDNCHEVIPLTQRVSSKVRDGGKRDGFGSLGAYREHLRVHVERESRVAIQSAHHSSDAHPTTSLQKSRQSLPTLAAHTPLTVASQGPASAPFRVKPEPMESTIPRKRQSDVGVKAERFDIDLSVPTPPKKLKTEPASHVSDHRDSRTGIRDMGTVQDVQAAIENQQRILKNLYMDIDNVSQEQINVVNDEIRRLRILATSYLHMQNLALQNSIVDQVVQNSSAEYQEERKPRMTPREFPMDLDLEIGERKPRTMDIDERKPLTIGMGLARHQVNLQAAHPPRPFPVMDGAERKPVVQTSSAPQSTPVASSSTSSSSVSPRSRITSFLNSVVASGSKSLYPSLEDVKPPSFEDIKPKIPGAFDMDSDGSEDDSEEEYELPANLAPFVERLGVHAPPPMLNNGYDAHDHNGDYHGRGRDLFVGPQAAADDIEKFLIEAGNAETFDGNESVDKALKYLGLHNLQEKIPGLEISLMAHQAMGVAWMLEKEKSGLLGGCLADEMGLGKTVQMITCMVKNRSVDPARKTTLIIAPLALLDQWKLEIEDKSNCGFSCLIYHGPSRTKKRSKLLDHDIVLTTFNTMAMEWPDYENEMKKKAKAKKQKRKDDFIVSDSDGEDMEDVHYRANKRKQQAGLLFQVEFYRIVADEGQQIRNKRTRMSRAITDLRTRYRWVLTGTPIVNGLSDVYGYIRFLRIRPWYDWLEFHTHIGKLEKKQPAIAVARLQKIMTTFLLRRKKDSKLDGKNLIELPEKKVELCKLEFSQEERDVYHMVELRSQAKFNRYLREGTVLKNYHQVLVLLLRLRQICSHPCLIQEDGVAFVHPDEAKVKPQFATELTRARRLVSSEFVEKMKEKFKQDALNRLQAEKQSANAAVEGEECPICYDAMTDAVITACGHIFCRDCIMDVLNQAPPPDAPEQANSKERPCPVCRSGVTEEKFFSRVAFEPSDKDLNDDADSDDESVMEVENYFNTPKGKSKGAAKSKKSGRISRRVVSDSEYESDDDDSDGDMSDFIVQSDEDEEEKDARRVIKARSGKKNAHIILDSDDEPDTPEEKEVIFGTRKKAPEILKDGVPLMSRFLPSTKMKFMMNLLQKLAKTNPEEKTLVVSQWTGCLSLVSDYLTENGIPHVKYQGDMNRTKREQAVQVFMSKEKARVMLMSLKCGGVGLNLTRANNVISLDLGWSQAVESQAYDRVHRLGQTRDVTVQRVVIADTVEDRILALQARKQALADGSLGEGSGQKIGKLTVKELANLFGLDARGRRLIA